MKKILSLLLVLAVLLGLTGCQASDPPDTSGITESTTVQTTVETQATDPETEPEVTEPLETQPVSKQEPTKPTAPKPTQPEETEPTEEPTQPEETRPQQTAPVETQPEPQPPLEPPETEPATEPAPQKSYTHKDEVAQYIHEHGRLPDNFITKSQARALGWRGGSLEKYAPGKCIGGDRFYNREGLLPEGHTYYECDIDTLGSSSRGAKRIVFSDDGLIYYTSDHYCSFTLLYGEP